MHKMFALLGASLVLAATPAEAISRYNSTSMSCQKARSIVSREGAVVFRYTSKRGNPIYDRFVKHGRLCAWGESTFVKFVSTNSGQCALYACRSHSHDDGLFRKKH